VPETLCYIYTRRYSLPLALTRTFIRSLSLTRPYTHALCPPPLWESGQKIEVQAVKRVPRVEWMYGWFGDTEGYVPFSYLKVLVREGEGKDVRVR